MPHRPVLRLLLAGCLIGFCAIFAGCSPLFARSGSDPSTRPTRDIAGLANFARVSDGLYRGAQPDADGFASLKKMGIKTVINLREWHSDLKMLGGTGIRYVQIPCAADRIDEDDVAKVIKIIRDPVNQPVFIHCRHGSDRTGLAIGIYRIIEEGWTAEEAEAELRAFGFHTIYNHIPQAMRGLRREQFNRLVEQAEAPKLTPVP